MITRCLRLLVSVAVLFYDRICSRIWRLTGREKPGSCTVLNYHVISDDVAAHFLRQMKALVKLANPVSAVRGLESQPGIAYVAVTFDDAFCSFVRNAWPVLRGLQIPVTVFVPTDYLGRRSAWVDYGGDNPVGEEVIDARTLLDIASDELVDVGSHTVTHANLVTLCDEAVRRELSESRETLEIMLGRRIESISFPYGNFGDRELRLCEEAGYRYQFSASPEGTLPLARGGLIGRVSVQPWDWPVEFRLKVLGAYRWVATASYLKHKLLAGFRGRF
jgi:peptidoglycan/xylan/chitin deacetylase (PgdA/CDA1 family)